MPEPRLDTYIWADIAFKNETGEGSIQNVGPGGLFVRSSTIGKTGDEVRLSFEGPDGEVVEVVESSGGRSTTSEAAARDCTVSVCA